MLYRAPTDCQYNQTCNEDLKGLTSLQVLDKIVAAAAARGIYIMLDMHSFEPDAYEENGLW
jgi:endoglucanase